MSELKLCPTCGEEYPLSERFCPRDGAALRLLDESGDLVGATIAGRYHVLRLLGEGGMGRVYLAEHVKLGRKVALKVLTPELSRETSAVERFNREAANASRLNHPNVCSVYDFGETPEGLLYLAMEFVEGETLTRVIELNGTLTPQRTAGIVEQIAAALGAAHDAGIVHRDLKPDNVMVSPTREQGERVKVVDFGIATSRMASGVAAHGMATSVRRVTRTGHVMGTPDYMSPEQLRGVEVDAQTDVYALGLVAFACLTGQLAFAPASSTDSVMRRLSVAPSRLGEVNPALAMASALQPVLDRALALNTIDRYTTAPQLAEAFRDAVVAGGGRARDAATVSLEPLERGGRGEGGERGRLEEREERRIGPLVLVGTLVIVAGLGVWSSLTSDATAADHPPDAGSAAQNATRPDSLPAGAAIATASHVAEQKVPLNKVGATGAADAPRAAVTPTGGAAVDTRAILDSIMGLVDGETTDKASTAISRINTLLPSLKGEERGEAYWRLGEARFTLKQKGGACEAMTEARRLLKGTKLAVSVEAYFDPEQEGLCVPSPAPAFA